MESNKEEIVIGIDLGTTNSIAAINRNGKAKIIQITGNNPIGHPIVPSMICLKRNDCLVGYARNNFRGQQINIHKNNNISWISLNQSQLSSQS